MRDAGDRLLGPVHAGQDLLDAPRQGLLAFVEPVDVLAGAGEFALRFAHLDVAAHRHPVAHILGDERQPVLVAPLVEQIRLVIKELLDLLLEEQEGDLFVSVGHSCTAVVRASRHALRAFLSMREFHHWH